MSAPSNPRLDTDFRRLASILGASQWQTLDIAEVVAAARTLGGSSSVTIADLPHGHAFMVVGEDGETLGTGASRETAQTEAIVEAVLRLQKSEDRLSSKLAEVCDAFRTLLDSGEALIASRRDADFSEV